MLLNPFERNFTNTIQTKFNKSKTNSPYFKHKKNQNRENKKKLRIVSKKNTSNRKILKLYLYQKFPACKKTENLEHY